jgi:hypothetical protein
MITSQPPGIAATSPQTFAIQIWDSVAETPTDDPPTGIGVNAASPGAVAESGEWVSIFGGNAIDLSYSIVNSVTEQYSPSVMTADFEFVCYVI